jgi:energy-coupling factor transporter ATP-binding protein EcfA2
MAQSKIDKIEIQNFKFFPKLEKPIEVNGKHILLYGENGSGKSSIYWALYTLLEASNKADIDDITKYFDPKNQERLLNINLDQTLPTTPKSYLQFSFLDNSKPFYLALDDTSINGNVDARKSNFSSDFINYRHLLNLYNFAHSEEIDIFHFFQYAVLPYVKFTPVKYWQKKKDGTIDDLNTDSASKIFDFVKRGPKRNKKTKGGKNRYPIRKEAEYTEFNNIVNGFYSNLETLITYINTEGNPILKDDLGYDITFKLILDRDRVLKSTKRYLNTDGAIITEVLFKNINKSIKDKDFHKDSFGLSGQNYEMPGFHIWLKITEYEGKKDVVNRAHSFLNEAKLTAVALAIRLAILKRTLDQDAKLKLLVFDDLMISLDMSNREKIINLILNKYIKEYQVFILTHDKVMFEDTKNHIQLHHASIAKKNGITEVDKLAGETIEKKIKEEIDNNWLFYEMYQATNKDNYTQPFITTNQTSIQKALFYFKEQVDYNACGNNLRRALEDFFISFIPQSYFRDKQFNPSPAVEKMLGKLIKKAYSYFEYVGYDTTILDALDRYIKRSLNPSSHYNPKANFYRKELEDIFKIYFQLNQLKRIPLLESNSILKFDVHTTDGTKYTYITQVMDDVLYYENGNSKYILDYKDKRKYGLIGCTENDITTQLFNNSATSLMSLEKLYLYTTDAIKKQKKQQPIFNYNFTDVYYDNDGVSLKDLLNKIA